MTFEDLLTQVTELLQRQGRVSYGALRRRFALDDAYLQDLKDELIDAQQLARDEGGTILVWQGRTAKEGTGHGTPEYPSLQTLAVVPPEAERRQLTVMFCDLVGSTPLAEKLDPEDLRQVILAYQQTCAEQIRRFDGYLARYIGDGLLVYFGYPQAHEDDAQRALRAGLGIVAALPDLNRRLQPTFSVLQDFPLQVRLGMHTGLVVAGDMGGWGYRDPLAIVGETPNIAARLQAMAEPDTVVMSEATQRLVQGLFTCRDLGPQELKGVSTPITVYRVLEESEVQSRFEVATRRGLTPLVGRAEELELLLRHWEQVKAGYGQVVLLTGEAGIGKSRLVQELKERVTRDGYTRIEFRCSPYYQHTAFYPVIDHLQRLLQFQRDDTPTAKLDKLEGLLRGYPLPLPEVVPLFAALLSLPQPDRYPPLTLTPQRQRQKTQEALGAWLLAEAEHRPLLAAWEDLQWADPSTLELHSLFLERAARARLLSVLTYRPEFQPPWDTHAHLTQLTLSRLPHRQVETMVEQVTGGKALPADVLRQIVAKTDGVPLFVEELTKMVLESGLVRQINNHYELTGPLPPLAIPSTLQDSLMARLDRLVTVKELAQLGATLGREFSYDLVQAVSPVDETSLQQALAQLVEAEVLYQRGLLPQARYVFKHALIQDAAYHSLLKSRRQQYHQQIAQVLEERFAEVVETQPELLAHHYTEAGLLPQALLYWQQAGQRAIARSAEMEAVAHLTKGLEVLKNLPDTLERTQQEVALYMILTPPLMSTRGYGDLTVEQALVRTRELCQQIGEPPQLWLVQMGLATFYLVRAELQTARQLGEHCLRLAQDLQDPALLLGTHLLVGIILYNLGEQVPARAHLEQGIALYDPQQHHYLAFVWGFDPGEHCLSFAALVLWLLGYPDQALKRSHEALSLARELSHPFSLAWALDVATVLHQHRREEQATQERAEEVITLTTEQGFAQVLAEGTILRGWALAEQGQRGEGIIQMRQGLSAYRATGAELRLPYSLILLAEVYGEVGQLEEGLSTVAEALAAVDKTAERFHEAELYRLKGTLTLQSKVQSLKSKVPTTQHPTPSTQAQAEAEACFHEAIEIARKQQAKSLELRAVMSLSRLWQSQGKKEEAQQMLAEIYGWFTEGFDTKDLQEAKALLEELA
jgi:class 3 adenylate cyclase/predicted ATPase